MEVRDAETGELLELLAPPAVSPTKHRARLDPQLNAETQSTRQLGDSVAWQRAQSERNEVRRLPLGCLVHASHSPWMQ